MPLANTANCPSLTPSAVPAEGTKFRSCQEVPTAHTDPSPLPSPRVPTSWALLLSVSRLSASLASASLDEGAGQKGVARAVFANTRIGSYFCHVLLLPWRKASPVARRLPSLARSRRVATSGAPTCREGGSTDGSTNAHRWYHELDAHRLAESRPCPGQCEYRDQPSCPSAVGTPSGDSGHV